MRQRRRVVVTGLGVVTPLGLNLEENWRKLLEGVSGIRRLELPGAEKSPIQAVGRVGEEDWQRILQRFPDESEGERRTPFALWAVRAALEDAGLPPSQGNGERWGAMVAAGLGIHRLENIARWLDAQGQFQHAGFSEHYREVAPDSILRCSSSRPAVLLSERLGLGAGVSTVTSACASATQAIGLSFRRVARGEADVMLAGGSDSMINPIGLMFFVLLTAASTARLDPLQVCRPFDRKRAGLVIGEGAGMVVLEELSHALARGARIYAEVAGYGSTLDAYQLTAPHPEGRGMERVMEQALTEGRLSAGDIDYINAHGTGTRLNDQAETLAIKRLFRTHASKLCISSSKSMIGHLMAAAGGPEFVYTVLSVQRDVIHPTLNLDYPDPKCDLDFVRHRGREKIVRAALSNSAGFGGQNASLAVVKYAGR